MFHICKLYNSMAYETRRFSAAFTCLMPGLPLKYLVMHLASLFHLYRPQCVRVGILKEKTPCC